MYRICDASGCFQSDSVAAVQQAILDGVDVINFSISGGRNPFADAVELAFLDAYAAGVIVNASAGNSGPGAGTADHGGPWTNTVAASTSNRHFFGNLTVTASNGDRFTMTGATVTAGIATATPVVLASEVPGQPNDLCAKPGEAGLQRRPCSSLPARSQERSSSVAERWARVCSRATTPSSAERQG